MRTAQASDTVRVSIHPLTAKRWPDLEALFGERGACGGCWCMTWRLPRAQFVKQKGSGNKRAFKRIVTAGEIPGILAYAGGRPVGWCAIAPREVYPALGRSRILKPVDDRSVWSISCLFVVRPFRRRRVSIQLLDAAVAHAGRRGARIVEGYPQIPYLDRVPDAFIWTGTEAAFRAAGFTEVARRSARRPIMRRTIGA